MGKSSSATASASGTGALTHEQVKALGHELLSSRAHLNHAPTLIALLSPSSNKPPLTVALEALISLHSFFEPLLPSIPSAAAAAAAAAADPELVFGAWLRQRFDEFVAALIELGVSPHSDDDIREMAFDAFMDFVKLGKDGKFHSAIYHKFLHAVVTSPSFLLSCIYISVRLGSLGPVCLDFCFCFWTGKAEAQTNTQQLESAGQKRW